MDNQELYEQALNAIKKLYGDTSVSYSTTIMSLLELKGEIQIMIDSLLPSRDSAGANDG